jgi:hypothetical protein
VVLPQGHSSNSSQCSGVRIPVWAASRPCSFACGYRLCPITAGSRLPRHGHNIDRHLQSAAGSLSRIFILPAYLRSHSFPFSVWLALRAEVARGNMTQQQALECLAMMQASSVPPSEEQSGLQQLPPGFNAGGTPGGTTQQQVAALSQRDCRISPLSRIIVMLALR